MKSKLFPKWLLLTVGAVFFANAYATDVVTKPGNYPSRPAGGCAATLTQSPEGGFLQLSVGQDFNRLTRIADDITAIAWVAPDLLVYSASPMYGKPGIFLLKCGDEPKSSVLVPPKHIDRGYPDGTDYFEIHSIDGNHVSYYYAVDVDKADFTKLRSTANLRTVELPTAK